MIYPQDLSVDVVFSLVSSGDMPKDEFKEWFEHNLEVASENGYDAGLTNIRESFGVVPA